MFIITWKQNVVGKRQNEVYTTTTTTTTIIIIIIIISISIVIIIVTYSLLSIILYCIQP